MNTVSGVSRQIVVEVWLQRSGRSIAVGVSEAVALADLTEQMTATASGKLQHTNMDAAFDQLRDAVWRLHDVSARVVRLDIEGLMELCKDALHPGDIAVLQDVPENLYALNKEAQELHINCSMLLGSGEWLRLMNRLEALYFDGDASFVHKHVSKNKMFPECFHDIWPPNGLPSAILRQDVSPDLARPASDELAHQALACQHAQTHWPASFVCKYEQHHGSLHSQMPEYWGPAKHGRLAGALPARGRR